MSSFTVASRDMVVREERCVDSKLETAWMGGKIDTLKVVVTKVEGERDDLKGLIEMMTGERKALCGRRENISREGDRNRDKIVGLRFLKVQAHDQGRDQGKA